jgi:hypothetical protein
MRCTKLTSVLGVVFAALLMLVLAAPNVRADQWNQLTYVHFGAPVEVPGYHGPMVLPAGTYTFKLLDSMADRNIVQIFNKSQSHLFTTVLAIPDLHLHPSGKTVIEFHEMPTGNPPALKAWFYPGMQYGQEFVYPKSRAVELAKATHEPVLSMPDEEAANMSKQVKSKNDVAVKSLENTQVRGQEPSGQEVAEGQVVQSPSNSANAKTQQRQ